MGPRVAIRQFSVFRVCALPRVSRFFFERGRGMIDSRRNLIFSPGVARSKSSDREGGKSRDFVELGEAKGPEGGEFCLARLFFRTRSAGCLGRWCLAGGDCDIQEGTPRRPFLPAAAPSGTRMEWNVTDYKKNANGPRRAGAICPKNLSWIQKKRALRSGVGGAGRRDANDFASAAQI